jgi:hypothetical protein
MIRNGSERGIGSLSVKILAGKYKKREIIELIADHLRIAWELNRKYFGETLREIGDTDIVLWDKILKALRKRGLKL